ncbi:MAG: hypothetical protein M3Z40_08420, partial [Bifidobacterium sp.]|nr:hypothetical protein [Bifidobacterium sp.]
DRWICNYIVGTGSIVPVIDDCVVIGWSGQCLCVHVSRRPLGGSRRQFEPDMWSNEPAIATKWMNKWISDVDLVSVALIQVLVGAAEAERRKMLR